MSHSNNTDVEYLTILAATSAEAMEQFSKRGLAAEGYSIAGRVGRHRVAVVTDGRSTEMLGDAMVAATFRRATRT